MREGALIGAAVGLVLLLIGLFRTQRAEGSLRSLVEIGPIGWLFLVLIPVGGCAGVGAYVGNVATSDDDNDPAPTLEQRLPTEDDFRDYAVFLSACADDVVAQYQTSRDRAVVVCTEEWYRLNPDVMRVDQP